jgi:hypothetical protein
MTTGIGGSSAGAGDSTGGTSDTAGTGGSTVDTDAMSQEPCGAEKEACCSDTTCGDPSLTCADHFCLVCNAIPALSPSCTDVALGVTPTASQTNPNNPLTNATDGSSCTAWGSGDYANANGSGLGTWIQLDLGSTHSIDSMTLWMEQTPADGNVLMRIETSVDGAAWTSFQDPADFTMLLHANDPWVTAFHDAQGQAIALRYLKITFLDSPSWISVRELALYECPVGGTTQ